MQRYIFIVYFIICLACTFLNGNIHNDDLNSYKFFQQRASSDFTKAQRKFQNQVLDAHNEYRARHCTGPVKLDDDISYSAQQYAEYLARNNILKHDYETDYGENLFKVASTAELDDFDGAEATRSWYDEIKYYSFRYPKYSKETGHFTQVIWKETEKIGVGFATSEYNSLYLLYVVVRYSPAGNVEDYFSKNVLRAKC